MSQKNASLLPPNAFWTSDILLKILFRSPLWILVNSKATLFKVPSSPELIPIALRSIFLFYFDKDGQLGLKKIELQKKLPEWESPTISLAVTVLPQAKSQLLR